MQQHTGQHLLSAVLAELFQFQTVSFHMGADVSTIELATKELTDEHMDQAEKRANTLARGGSLLRVGFEASGQVAGLRKQSERSGMLRIVEIPGTDKSACGGTHVRSIAEICPIQIRRAEKIRGNVRIEFVCGERATERAKADFRVLRELSRQSACRLDKLATHFAAVQSRLADLEKERQRLASELAEKEGREMYLATAQDTDGIRRVRISANEIDQSVRAKAIAFAGQPKALILVVGEKPAGVLIASSPDSGVNAGAVLKQVLIAAGGRGGGSATLAQGSLPNISVLENLAEALGFKPNLRG
jgi:alanyl-tRNA synthetase